LRIRCPLAHCTLLHDVPICTTLPVGQMLDTAMRTCLPNTDEAARHQRRQQICLIASHLLSPLKLGIFSNVWQPSAHCYDQDCTQSVNYWRWSACTSCDIPCYLSGHSGGGLRDNVPSYLHVDVVLNPLSKAAQRVAPILEWLRSSFHASIKVQLGPVSACCGLLCYLAPPLQCCPSMH